MAARTGIEALLGLILAPDDHWRHVRLGIG
jgi:hypothetical protein